MRGWLLFLGILALKSYSVGDILPAGTMDTSRLCNGTEELESVYLYPRNGDERPQQCPGIYLAQVVEHDAESNPNRHPSGKKSIKAVLACEATGEPLTAFPPETTTLFLRWQGEILNPGDKVRCVWIAEDVGEAAPLNYEVSETAATVSEPPAFGTFTLSRPTKGWPLGKYRAELYVGDTLAETLKFTIAKAEP